MRAVIGKGSIRVPRDAKEIMESREAGYEGPRKKRKAGGAVSGAKPKARLDKKPRRAGGGEVYHGTMTDTKKMPLTTTQVDAEGPPKRAMGGHVGKKHRSGKTNIIIHAGGGAGQPDPAAMQQAHQAGMQKGAQMGAMAAMQKMKGAGGAPGAPNAAPPPMPGVGAGAPPPPPAMAPPMGGPMRKAGGRVEGHKAKLRGKTETIKVREHTRRRSGGGV